MFSAENVLHGVYSFSCKDWFLGNFQVENRQMHPMGHMAFVSMETLALQSCSGDDTIAGIAGG